MVGENCTGKTTCLNVLSEALNNGCGENEEKGLDIFTINPKSLLLNNLFGYFN